jgi:hypothetical protein
MNTNRALQGDIFDVGLPEGCFIYLAMHDPNQAIPFLSLPFEYTSSASAGIVYNLEEGLNLTGFVQMPDGYTSLHLFNDPNMMDAAECIFHYLPQEGKFETQYKFFGRPSGNPFQIIEWNCYGIEARKKATNWRPW